MILKYSPLQKLLTNGVTYAYTHSVYSVTMSNDF
jgi:hypothetical protein